MPNQLDNTGLTVKTLTEIIDEITVAMQVIYGSDINVDPNSPDGQQINLYAQAARDQLELLVQIFNSFDPDSVSGTLLDRRFALNGVSRTAGTYTIQPVSITVDQSLTLYGLDQSVEDVFTVEDDNGNQFYLVTTIALDDETQSLPFRAVEIGLVETLQNTITNQVTITTGVTVVNNPLVATSNGVDEETDARYRIRRNKSFLLQAQSPADAVEAALLDTEGVTDALVGENVTDAPLGGISAHAIWAIVENGTDEDVATAIYNTKAPGCNMDGAESYEITRPNSQTIDILFDRPTDEPLHIEIGITAKIAGQSFDLDYIKAQIVERYVFGINLQATANDLLLILLAIEPNAIYTQMGFNNDGGAVFAETLSPTTIQDKFSLEVANIDIGVP